MMIVLDRDIMIIVNILPLIILTLMNILLVTPNNKILDIITIVVNFWPAWNYDTCLFVFQEMRDAWPLPAHLIQSLCSIRTSKRRDKIGWKKISIFKPNHHLNEAVTPPGQFIFIYARCELTDNDELSPISIHTRIFSSTAIKIRNLSNILHA